VALFVYGPHTVVYIYGPHTVVYIYGPHTVVYIYGPDTVVYIYGPDTVVYIYGPDTVVYIYGPHTVVHIYGVYRPATKKSSPPPVRRNHAYAPSASESDMLDETLMSRDFGTRQHMSGTKPILSRDRYTQILTSTTKCSHVVSLSVIVCP